MRWWRDESATIGAITRIALIVLGLILGVYGAVLVWENPPVIIMRILVWALVGVVLHDAVFAPVCVALGFAARRLIPDKWWAPIAVAAFCSVVLAFLAIPVYGKPGMRPGQFDRAGPQLSTGAVHLARDCVAVPADLLLGGAAATSSSG